MDDDFLLMPRIINSAIAGFIASFLVYPIDLIKTRFQSPAGPKIYKSVPNAFVKIYQLEGFLGLYRGLAVNIALVTPELVLNIAGNDFFRKLFQPSKGEEGLFRQIMAGAATGLLTTSINSPMELLKIQMQNEGQTGQVSDSVVKTKLTARTVFANIVRKDGFLGVYKGILPCILRDVPFCTLYFVIFALLYDLGPVGANGEATSAWSLCSGCCSGSISGFLTTPFDVVKTRLQTLPAVGETAQYNGVIDTVRKIYHKEGFYAFYRGAGCRMLIIAPLFGITEMIYYFGVAETMLNLPTQKFVR